MNHTFSKVLIALGASDLILWIFSGLESGWLEYIVGVNVLSQYGSWGMISLGIWGLTKAKAQDKMELDLIKELDDDEQVVFKHSGHSTLITLTNKRIIFNAFSIEDKIVEGNKNVVAESKVIFNYDTIESVKPVKTKETATTKFGGALNMEFGVQLTMNDGSINNLLTSKSEIISAHISKQLGI
jgi:hypothetical protein